MRKLYTFLLFLIFSSCKNASTKTDNKITDSTGNVNTNIKPLTSPADSISAEPYLFTDKNGVVYLSWIEKMKQQYFLKFSTISNDQWTEPKVISSGNNWFVNWADYPLLATDGVNSMVAHFL